MAVSYFLKIDGIDGESADTKHRGEIDIESFSWGETNSGNAAHGGGGGAGKVAPQDFHFVMHFNKASLKLFLACASGEHIKQAVLTVRKAGEAQVDFLKWTLSDCIVISYETGGNKVAVNESTKSPEEPSPEVTAVRNMDEAFPADEFILDFAKLEVSYFLQNPDGVPTEEKAGWDFRTNKKV